MFLDLMPVVEKPEIVQAKEQKLKSLGQKYVVKLLIVCWCIKESRHAGQVKTPLQLPL